MAKRTKLRERVSFRNKWAVKRFKLARQIVRVWVCVRGVRVSFYCRFIVAKTSGLAKS